MVMMMNLIPRARFLERRRCVWADLHWAAGLTAREKQAWGEGYSVFEIEIEIRNKEATSPRSSQVLEVIV